jgi:hypothetical protein
MLGVPDWPIRVFTVRSSEGGMVGTSCLEENINELIPKFSIHSRFL